jgi:hypothetical protein
MGKYPHFRQIFCKPKSYVQNDVKTALIRCISHLQYWSVWNEFQTFEYSRIHIFETKQGLSNEYQSNITCIAKRKSKPLIRPNSMCFYDPSRCDGDIPQFSILILQTKVMRTKWCENRSNSMHFTHPILKRLERESNVRILPNIYRWNQQDLSSEYQSNFTSMAKPKSKPLIRPNSMCF